jgi:hypothetical protein
VARAPSMNSAPSTKFQMNLLTNEHLKVHKIN